MLSQSSFCQSSHGMILGANFPKSYNNALLARGVGVEAGYDYEKYISDNFSLNSGIVANVYSLQNWSENVTVEFYIPFNLGYSINKLRISAGVAFNASKFIGFSKFDGMDPEIGTGYEQPDPYADVNSFRTFSIGVNVNLDYQISKKVSLYASHRTLKLNSEIPTTATYYYGLTAVGFKVRFKKK